MRRALALLLFALPACSGCPGSIRGPAPSSVATLASQPLQVSLGEDGSLVVALDERVLGLAGGTESWSLPVAGAGFLLRLADGDVLVPAPGKLLLLNALSGQERRSFPLPPLPQEPDEEQSGPPLARAAVLSGAEIIVLLADGRLYLLAPGCTAADGCLHLAGYLPDEELDEDVRLLVAPDGPWVLVETGILRLLTVAPLEAGLARIDLARAAKLGVRRDDVAEALADGAGIRGVLALAPDRIRFEAPPDGLAKLGKLPLEREEGPPLRLEDVAVLELVPGGARTVRFELQARDLLGGVALRDGRLAVAIDEELVLLDLAACAAPGTSALPLRKGQDDDGCDDCKAPPEGCVLWHRHERDLGLHDPALLPDGTVVANGEDRTIAIRDGALRWATDNESEGGGGSVREAGDVTLVAAVDDDRASPLSLLQLSSADGSLRRRTRTGFGPPGETYSTDELFLERAGRFVVIGHEKQLALVELSAP